MLVALLSVLVGAGAFAASRACDPCEAIAGQTWVASSAVRACFASFPVNETVKANILDVVERTLAFHTSVNYQLQAPEPFNDDVHEDILANIARIRNTSYASEFEFHVDLSRSVKRLKDGHCLYTDKCYDNLYVSYLPTPLVLLSDEQGEQAVYIAPEAYDVVRVEFADQISAWQEALPEGLTLESLSGAKVLAINGKDPFDAMNANAEIAGSYQGLGERQNGFFSSYQRTATGWNYTMGDFAQTTLPTDDSVELTVQLAKSSTTKTFSLAYYSRFGARSLEFTNSTTFRQNNCVAVYGTNGNYPPRGDPRSEADDGEREPVAAVQNPPEVQNIALPDHLQPGKPIFGTNTATFYLLDDGKTGVMALGSFTMRKLAWLQSTLLAGLQDLVDGGATQLIIDVTNNGGGLICGAAWLHRIIAGPKNTTEPQALLDTEVRAGPLAQLITKHIAEGADPTNILMYNPKHFRFANNTQMPSGYDWLADPVEKTINGRQDAFSQRLGQNCQPFNMTPPEKPLFDPTKVVIVGNGRCASSCAMFSVTMNKMEGSKTVVVGGKKDVRQHYAGYVGGEVVDFSSIDSSVKYTGLKNDSLAPPDLLSNSLMTVNWRLSFGVRDPEQPEEFQDRTADVTIPLTIDLVNKPLAIWKKVATTVF